MSKYYRKNIENAGNTLPNFFQCFNYTFLSYYSILCLRYHNHKRLQISRNFSSFCNLVKFIFRGKVFNYLILQVYFKLSFKYFIILRVLTVTWGVIRVATLLKKLWSFTSLTLVTLLSRGPLVLLQKAAPGTR